jgi:hypothetical protein
MSKIKAAPLALLLLGLLLPLTASAHNASPLHTDTVTAGAYTLTVAYFSWPLRAEQDAQILITPADGNYQNRELGLGVILNPPAAGGGGRSVTEAVRPDPDTKNGYAVDVRPAYVGTWGLLLNVHGPQGDDGTVISVPVDGPPSIPEWLGWAVGFVPLLGLLGFALSEGRKVSKAKLELARD